MLKFLFAGIIYFYPIYAFASGDIVDLLKNIPIFWEEHQDRVARDKADREEEDARISKINEELKNYSPLTTEEQKIYSLFTMIEIEVAIFIQDGSEYGVTEAVEYFKLEMQKAGNGVRLC